MAKAQGVPSPTREELQRQEVERDLQADANSLSVEGTVERAPCPLAGPQFADLRFTLSTASFDGLSSLDAAMLAPAWQEHVGQEIPVAKICEIRDRAATILRGKGYLAAVQVPEQTIDTGEVRFDVILARIAAVQVRGDAGRSTPLLQGYLQKLQGQEVFNTQEAERYLLLARDVPGLDVRLTLQPLPADQGGTRGDVVGVFDVIYEPVYVDANIQNFGSNSVGRFGGLLRARANGLTGLGDETMLSVYSAQDWDEQIVLSGHHEFRVGSEGLTLGLSGTYAWTQPDVVDGPDPFETETFVGSAYARYPLVRSQAENLTLWGGLDFIEQQVEFTGLDFSEDKLRVGFLRADYQSTDRASIAGEGGYSAVEPKIAYQATLEVRQGVGILGSSDSCGPALVNCIGAGVVPISRLDADPTGFVVRGQSQLDFRPDPMWGLRSTARFQYSPDPLLGYEQFSGGNYTVGRGYDPGAVIGDIGVGWQLEAFYGTLLPDSDDNAAIQPFVFFDLAATKTNNLNDDWKEIYSAGGGVRMSIGRQAVLDLVTAIPLKTPDFATRKGSTRLLMSLTVQLAPWL